MIAIVIPVYVITGPVVDKALARAARIIRLS